jgi:predicted nucleotidyltransferase
MNMLPKSVQAAVEYLQRQIGDNGTVFLFGSRARGAHRPGGDFDIALMTAAGTTWQQFCVWRSTAADIAWPYRIDVVDLTRAPAEFLDVIKDEMIPLYETMDEERSETA